MNHEVNWMPVKGYEGQYMISSAGALLSLSKKDAGKELKQRINTKGYSAVRLSKKGKRRTVEMHRLVALAFIPNPDAKCCVNHKDGNKQNNDAANLEWVTPKENMQHALANGLLKPKGKLVIDHCNKVSFPSIAAASKHYNINYSTLKNYLNGNRVNLTCLQLSRQAA